MAEAEPRAAQPEAAGIASAGEEISWLPGWVPAGALAHYRVAPAPGRGAEAVAFRCRRPRPSGWDALGEGLRRAQAALAAMPVAEIVAAVDRAAARWGERAWPVRRAACAQVVRATGFSEEVVERSFDVELRNYRAPSLWRALCRELGDPGVLDAFVADEALGGWTRAHGPRVTLEVFTGNVPGLPALSIVRALLVKSAVIAKVASGEPTFAAHFARSLYASDPRLGDAVVVTYWERDDAATLEAVLAQADAVIAYGGAEACAAMRAAARPDQVFVEHGPKLSVGVVSQAYLAREGAAAVAARLARDVSMFNQHACIAPQAVLVEGDAAAGRALAEALAHALDAYRRECPLGTLGADDAAALQLRRAAQAWRAAARADGMLRQADGLDWTVALDDALAGEGGGGQRFVRVVPVAGLAEVAAVLRPVASHLQNVALGAVGAELPALAGAIAGLGASRLCAPGRMAEPSLMWRHDGQMCLAELVRWCDVEMHDDWGRAAAGAAGREGEAA